MRRERGKNPHKNTYLCRHTLAPLLIHTVGQRAKHLDQHHFASAIFHQLEIINHITTVFP